MYEPMKALHFNRNIKRKNAGNGAVNAGIGEAIKLT